MTFWHFLVANWGKISIALLLVLKWIYNAWTPNVTFPQFIRQLISEIVQEQPENFKEQVIAEQQKKLAQAQGKSA
jgi:hypothetical protein